jgi:hypothetical protein
MTTRYLTIEIERRNPAHALDGGIALQFHIPDYWPAASDVIRWP